MMEMTKKIGVGIRGTGQVAVQHVAAFNANPHTYVAAICGRSDESTNRFIAQYAPGAKAYTHLEDMLNDPEIGIVTECMPNYLHAKETLMILDAGKHIMLEKPAGITEEETDALYDAAKKTKLKTVVSFCGRWYPLTVKIRDLIVNQKAIGDVFFCGCDYWHGIQPTFSSYNWIRQKQFAGGAMITGGCHAASTARYLNGDIVEVCAFSTHYRQDFDYETTLSAAVKYENGSVGRLSACLDGLNFPYQANRDILGSEGAIRGTKIWSKKLFPDQTEWFDLEPGGGPQTGEVSHHPFKPIVNQFVDSILNDTPVYADLADSVKSMDVVIAITESARTGKPISIKKRV